MRKLFIILILMSLSLSLFSQKLSEGIYLVSLADKAGNGLSLSVPGEFLSQRSLYRRERQNISLSEEDLPVSSIYLGNLSNLGIKILGSSRWFNAVIIQSFDTLLLDTLHHYSYIKEFKFEIPRKKAIPNNDFTKKTLPFTQNQQNTDANYGLSFAQIELLNGNALHDLGYRGNNLHIAVIDGGFFNANIYPAFDSLWNEGRLLGFRDFSHSSKDFFNTNSHGMSVLSTMAANVPGEIIGTAPKSSYWLLKSEIVESESPLEEAYWLLAAEFADSVGADIITGSLGYSEFDDASLNYKYSDMDGQTTLVTRAAEKAFSKGMVVVSSAGNEGNKPWKHIMAPSDGPNVLAIGATDTSGNVSAFSSRGPTADLRTKPDVMAVGYKTAVINSKGILSEGFGTSFAAPLISGMVACLWEASPEKTNLEIIQAIKRSSSNYLSVSDSAGYGIPDFLLALYILKSSIPSLPANRLSVVPNPNQGVFELRSEFFPDKNLLISIYDIKGNKIYSGNKSFAAGFEKINELEGQSPGIYYIVAQTNDVKYFTKVVILNP